MTANLSNAMVGLSLMSGSNVFVSGVPGTPGIGGVSVESRAVRVARAQFTMPATTPPWKDAADPRPLSAQVSAVRAMATIIDKAVTGPNVLPADVQTSFTAYKALDRLRLLAETAAATTTSDAQRSLLNASFGKGLSDLNDFLAAAPSDRLNLAFAQPARGTQSVGIVEPDAYRVAGAGLVTNRTDPVPGLSGTEVFRITLEKRDVRDSVTIDLAQGAQPPTIDSMVDQFNAALASIPLRNPDGTPYVDENGQTQPRWIVRFVPDKATDKWGFALESPSGVERLTIEQENPASALMVATGQTAPDAPGAAQIFRIDDPAGTAAKQATTTLTALDRAASERAALLGKFSVTGLRAVKGAFGSTTTETVKSSDIHAATDAAAIATDRFGNSYVVGTSAGDMGAQLSDGTDRLFLTKVDSRGAVVWQRSLGAGGADAMARGAAVSVDADGNVTVAGTVSGSFEGTTSDGDMLVARFGADGEEYYATLIRHAGADSARALAVGADGTAYVAGRGAGGAGFLARVDASGHVAEKYSLSENGAVQALAIGADGNPVALVNNDGVARVLRFDARALSDVLGAVSLGTADARALAVAADGTIAVGGATRAALSAVADNGYGDGSGNGAGGRDGFVARLSPDLSSAHVTYLATAADDQVDSLTFLDGRIYAGGRTTGALGGARRGIVDGFVASVDAGNGALGTVTQFGLTQTRADPVRLSATNAGGTVVRALGFAAGTLNPPVSGQLVGATALRPGDSFAVRVNGGATRRVEIGAADTMATLADRLRAILGSHANVTTPRLNGQRSLRIDARAGNAVEWIAGPDGADALSRMGIAAQRIVAAPPRAADAPSVAPGGSFGLSLTQSLSIATAEDAKVALGRIKDAVSMSQTAYRSLYWDDGKAALVDGGAAGKTRVGGSTAREQAQLANYQAALTRLSSSDPTLGLF